MKLLNLVFILAVTTLLPCLILGRPSEEAKEQEIAEIDARVYDEDIIDEYDYEDNNVTNIEDNNVADKNDEGNQSIDEYVDKEEIKDEKHDEHDEIDGKSVEEKEVEQVEEEDHEEEEEEEEEEKEDYDNKGSEEQSEQQGFTDNIGDAELEINVENEGDSNGGHPQNNGNQSGKENSNSLFNKVISTVNYTIGTLDAVKDIARAVNKTTGVIMDVKNRLLTTTTPSYPKRNIDRNPGGHGNMRPTKGPLKPAGNKKNHENAIGSKTKRTTRAPSNAIRNGNNGQKPGPLNNWRTTRAPQKPIRNGNNYENARPPYFIQNKPTQRPWNKNVQTTSNYRNQRTTKRSKTWLA